jgi:hypothetical protein
VDLSLAPLYSPLSHAPRKKTRGAPFRRRSEIRWFPTVQERGRRQEHQPASFTSRSTRQFAHPARNCSPFHSTTIARALTSHKLVRLFEVSGNRPAPSVDHSTPSFSPLGLEAVSSRWVWGRSACWAGAGIGRAGPLIAFASLPYGAR